MEGLICLEHKLSIVIPVYNGGDLLIRTLDALCGQTFGDFELIVIDDGSTDDTAVRLARYAEKEPRLKSFIVQNGGPSRARNYGISKAEGDYLYLCDADDLPEPTLLERLVRELDGGADLAACGYWQERVSESGETVSSPFSVEACRCESHEAFLKALPGLMEKQLMYVNWNKMYRMEIIRRENIRFTEEFASCEDRLFNLEYDAHVERFSFIEEKLFHYYVRGGSLNSKFLPSRYASLCCFDRQLNALYEAGGLLTDEVKAMNARFFIKGVMACLASFSHPSCTLGKTEKKTGIRQILDSEELKNALSHLSGGLSWKAIGLVLGSGSAALAGLMGKAVAFSSGKLPGLVQKLKSRQ